MQDELTSVVEYIEGKGADFVEARFDKLEIRVITRSNGRIRNCQVTNRSGYGFQIYKDGGVGYAFTPESSNAILKEKAEEALGIAKATSKGAEVKLEVQRSDPVEHLGVKPNIHQPAWELETSDRFELLYRMENAAEDTSEEIKSKFSLYAELSGEKFFTNSDGTKIQWFPAIVDLGIQLSGKTQSGALASVMNKHGGTAGMELYEVDRYTPESLGKTSASWLEDKLVGKDTPAGNHRALTGNLLTGVLAHETFGHLTEGDYVATGVSPLAEKLGEKLGTETATIVDAGTMEERSPDIVPNYLPFDDEGTVAGKTTILEKGVATGFLNSKSTASLTDNRITGNARAIDFTFAPIPRMRNTYFETGDIKSEEEALEVLGTGIYAAGVGGGQTSGTGHFQFTTTRAYWVENGEISYPLRDVTIAGNVMEFLKNIEDATTDFKMNAGYFGGCGKRGQVPLPVGVGGPKLILSSARFGGKA